MPLGNKGNICFYRIPWKNIPFKHCSKALNMSDFIFYIWTLFSPLKKKRAKIANWWNNCYCAVSTSMRILLWGCAHNRTFILNLCTLNEFHSIFTLSPSAASPNPPKVTEVPLIIPVNGSSLPQLQRLTVPGDFHHYCSCFQSKQWQSWHDLPKRRTWLGTSTRPSKY